MTLLTHLPVAAGWDVGVLGTDISTRALDKAARGLWPIERSSHIPPPYLKAFMLRGTRSQEGNMAVSDELREVVELRRFNLSAETYPFDGELDLIFCRNVLIYFDVDSRRHVLDELARCLAPHGLLFLGHAETAAGSHGAPPSRSPHGLRARAMKAATRSIARSASAGEARIHVLVVDDSAVVRQVLTGLLLEPGGDRGPALPETPSSRWRRWRGAARTSSSSTCTCLGWTASPSCERSCVRIPSPWWSAPAWPVTAPTPPFAPWPRGRSISSTSPRWGSATSSTSPR